MLFGGVFRRAAPSTWSTISSTFTKHPTSALSLTPTPNSSLLRFNCRAASTRSAPAYSLATASPKIRHAIRDLRNLEQGYQIFRLSYDKTYQSIEAARNNPSEQSSLEHRTKVAAIQTKLAAHTFAHALLRRGCALEASRFVELCMERNIRIHYRTFQATFNLLCPRVDHRVDTVGPPSHVTVPPPTEVGPTPRPNPQRPGASQMYTTAALSLLRSARQGRHGRASWMYDRIIDACLLQGEVLTAALLFVALVRDWMLRKAIKESLHNSPSHPSAPEQRPDLDWQEARRLGMDWHPELTFPQPRAGMLHRIISATGLDESPNAVKRYKWPVRPPDAEALSALYALIELLQSGELQGTPVGALWPLLRTMASLPREKHRGVEEYERTHSTLLALCADPLGNTRKERLDLQSYNVLLRYALRHRRSPGLGLAVLRRLCEHHNPNSMTWNILLREATLMQANVVVHALIAHLAARHPGTVDLFVDSSTSPDLEVPPSMEPWSAILSLVLSRPPPYPDEATYLALISFAIATTRSHLACSYILSQFPDLAKSTWDPRLHKQSTLKHARHYSPYFWSVSLNAACKAGNWELATGIWRLAVRVDTWKQRPEVANGVETEDGDGLRMVWGDDGKGIKARHRPVLTVEAYTVMLQLYASRLTAVQASGDAFDSLNGRNLRRLLKSYMPIINHAELVIYSLSAPGKSRKGFQPMQIFPPNSHGLLQPEAERAKEAVDARLLDALEAFLKLIKEMEPVFIKASRRPIATNGLDEGTEWLSLRDQLRARKVEVLTRHVGRLLRSWGRIPRVVASNAGELRNTTSGTGGVVPYASVKLADTIRPSQKLAARCRYRDALGSVTRRRAIRLRRPRFVNTRGLPVLVTLGEGDGSISDAPELKLDGFAGIMMGRLQKEDQSKDLTKRGQVLVLEPTSDLGTLKRRVESRLPF
jgi:hypothetical protein